MARRNGHDNKPELLEERKLTELTEYVRLRKAELGPQHYRAGLEQQIEAYKQQLAPIVVRFEQYIDKHPKADHIPPLETQRACPHFDCQVSYFKGSIAELEGLIADCNKLMEAAG